MHTIIQDYMHKLTITLALITPAIAISQIVKYSVVHCNRLQRFKSLSLTSTF